MMQTSLNILRMIRKIPRMLMYMYQARSFELFKPALAHPFFLVGIKYAKSLGQIGARFDVDDEGEIVIQVNGVRAIVQTVGELYILNEVFVDGVYDFFHDKPVVVWDIGMNTGLASLFFASKENVVVAAYEPFPTTYAQACRNFGLNPQISNRITPHNYGIGRSNRRARVDYCPRHKEHMTSLGIPPRIRTKVRAAVTEDIAIQDACEVLESIVSDYPGRDIIAKLDCEGSEYEIIAGLGDKGKLSCLRAVMIEWHREANAHGPSPIVETLLETGFTVFSLVPSGEICGMIYAVKGA